MMGGHIASPYHSHFSNWGGERFSSIFHILNFQIMMGGVVQARLCTDFSIFGSFFD